MVTYIYCLCITYEINGYSRIHKDFCKALGSTSRAVAGEKGKNAELEQLVVEKDLFLFYFCIGITVYSFGLVGTGG